MPTKNIFAILSKEELKSLYREVIETLDIDFSDLKKKKFTTFDLWNIQRKGIRRQYKPFF